MILKANHVITSGNNVLSGGAVRIDGNTVGQVGDAASITAANPGDEIRDYGEATILPGLIDMHVHFGYYYSQPDAHEYDDYMVAYYAAKQAAHAFASGITTVRDLSSPAGLLKQMRKAGEKGFLQVPRMIHTDTGICMTGGHGHEDGIEEADGPWNIRAAIRRQRRDGADWIKLLTSNRDPIPEFTKEELDAAVDECRRRGIKCAIHAGLQPAIEMAVNAGFDTIEHGTLMTVEQAKRMAENGQAWTPTITAYTVLYEFTKKIVEEGGDLSNPIAARAVRDMYFFEPAYRAYKDNFKKLFDTGVTVLAGTDMVLREAPPFPIYRELALMVEYGITPLEAIATATLNPAKVLGLDKVTGRLEAGLEADILVVDGNAAADIRAIEAVRAVFLAGKPVYNRR